VTRALIRRLFHQIRQKAYGQFSRAQPQKRSVDDLLAGFVQIQFDRLEGRPPADGHHHAGVHPFVDEEPLGEAPSKIVARDIPKVGVAGAVGGSLGGSADDSPDAAGGEVNVRIVVIQPAVAGKLVEVSLDVAGKVGIARLAVAVLRVPALRNAQAEVVAIAGAADVFRLPEKSSYPFQRINCRCQTAL